MASAAKKSSSDQVFELKTKIVQFWYINNFWKLYYFSFFAGGRVRASCRKAPGHCKNCTMDRIHGQHEPIKIHPSQSMEWCLLTSANKPAPELQKNLNFTWLI